MAPHLPTAAIFSRYFPVWLTAMYGRAFQAACIFPVICRRCEPGSTGRVAADLEKRILDALKAPDRTEGVRKIAARFGVDPSTVQRISRPFEIAGVAV